MGSRSSKILNVKKGEEYHDVFDDISSMDLILFKGGDYVSDLIRFTEGKFLPENSSDENMTISTDPNDFSHCGVAIRSDVYSPLPDGRLYILESTMSGRLSDGVNDIHGHSFWGVQIRDFEEVVKKYNHPDDTAIAVCHLKNPPVPELVRKHTEEYINSVIGRRYNANPISLIGSMFKCLRPTRDEVENATKTESLLFCSEMVGELYVKLGLLPQDVQPNNIVPMDYLGYDTDDFGKLPVIVKSPRYINTEEHMRST